jgi:hypothetical protein
MGPLTWGLTMPGLLLTGVALCAALIMVATLVVIRHWRRSKGQSPAPVGARGAAAGPARNAVAPHEIAIVPGFSDTVPPGPGAQVPVPPAGGAPAGQAGGPPPQQRLNREADLGEDEIGGSLPVGQGTERRGHPDAEGRYSGERGIARQVASFLDHRPHGKLTGTPARTGLVAVDEQELVHAVGRCGEHVPAEAEQIAVPGV